ncbi:unnamed protein product [Pipistrellus nathusii]|uniref:Uncharacterized protein n=1 Tax=Pipistrellus nathusii TaxID=59473 RepID=A0ABN9ZKU0_PIPNA
MLQPCPYPGKERLFSLLAPPTSAGRRRKPEVKLPLVAEVPHLSRNRDGGGLQRAGASREIPPFFFPPLPPAPLHSWPQLA